MKLFIGTQISPERANQLVSALPAHNLSIKQTERGHYLGIVMDTHNNLQELINITKILEDVLGYQLNLTHFEVFINA